MIEWVMKGRKREALGEKGKSRHGVLGATFRSSLHTGAVETEPKSWLVQGFRPSARLVYFACNAIKVTETEGIAFPHR